MRLSVFVLLLAGLSSLLPPSAARAALQWKRLESPHFEMFTTTSEREGRGILEHFERVRAFFLARTGKTDLDDLPVRIIVLNNAKEWEKYRVSQAAAAFYQAGLTRDYIVMGDTSDQVLQAATHEFTHLIIQHSGSKLPIWLNEGTAELYSNLHPSGNKVKVGDLIPGRTMVLAQEKWIPIEQLLAVGHDSPLYNEKNRAGVFYSESWLLVHMLYLSERYRAKTPAFLAAIADGKDSRQAFQTVYGVDEQEIGSELNRYFRGDRFYAILFDIQLPKNMEKAPARFAAAVEAELQTAQLYILADKKDQAASILRRLAQENPKDVDVAETEAEAAAHAQDMQAFELSAKRAIDLGSTNKALRWHYAERLAYSNRGAGELQPLLEQVLAGDPSNLEARLLLIDTLLARSDFRGAVKQINQVKRITPEFAAHFFCQGAQASWMLGDRDQAKKALARAKPYAKEPRDVSLYHSLEQYFQRVEMSEQANAMAAQAQPAGRVDVERPFVTRSPAKTSSPQAQQQEEPSDVEKYFRPAQCRDGRIERTGGVLERIDCQGPRAVFTVRDPSGTRLKLLSENPESVMILGAGKGTFEFACGEQKSMPLVAEYAARQSLPKGIDGVLCALDLTRRSSPDKP